MTAVDKIIERIMLDAKAEAKEIVAKGKLRAKEIIKSATDEAKALEKELKIATDKKAEAGSQSADSAAKLSIRNAVLMKKREEIEKTLDALLEHFLTLGAEEYFDVLLKLVEIRATGKEGVMLLNSKDLARLPQGFEKAVAEFNITVSKEPHETIGGGFILKYNDIEENADFKAIIDEKKEILTDIINKELF